MPTTEDAVHDARDGAAPTAAAVAPAPSSAPTSVAPASAPVKERKRRARGKNFHAHEDLRLCASWLHVSEQDALLASTASGDKADPEQEESADSTTSFWERVCAFFNDDTTQASDATYRSYQSLQSRWSALQATIARFGDIWKQVQAEQKAAAMAAGSDKQHPGSTTSNPKWTRDALLRETHFRYVEQHPKQAPFASQPCWEFLKKRRRWQLYVNRKGKGRVRRGRHDVQRGGGESSGGEEEEDESGEEGGETGSESSGGGHANVETDETRKKRKHAEDDGSSEASARATKHDQRCEDARSSTVVGTQTERLYGSDHSTAVDGFLSLFSPPVAFSEDEQVVQWTVRENRTRGGDDGSQVQGASPVFAVFDDNRRIEVLASGVYQLNLYLEPQGNDESKYYLEINGTPLVAFRDTAPSSTLATPAAAPESAGKSRSSRRSSTHGPVQVYEEDIPLKTANVAEVRLNKWDMLALRRKADTTDRDPKPGSSSSVGKTPFGRLIIETVRST